MTKATTEALLEFIKDSPSPFHCVKSAAERLLAVGFTECFRDEAPRSLASGTGAFIRDGGMILAWRAGTQAPAEAGFRIVVAHTDSPNLRVKPKASYSAEGYVQWGVEPYGGVLWHTWLDRDLGLSGQVAVRTADGGFETHLICIEDAIARIPSLAIHLNRTVNSEGLKLNAQKHLAPVLGLGDGADESFHRRIAQEIGCQPEDILDYELGFHTTEAPSVGGLDGDFIFCPRLDNQFCSYAALAALIGAQAGPATQVIALYDHEEVGSTSSRGADSGMLHRLLTRLERDMAGHAPGGLDRALANSYLVSADMAHGVHPNHAEQHEPRHKPIINGGPVIKTNVNMRYMSDSESASRFRLACEAVNVPVQDFVTRSDLGCGSTVGPYCASQLNVSTVDVGCAMLSMHSAREMGGAHDLEPFVKVLIHIMEN